MNGYYTVEVKGNDLTPGRRIELETRYAVEFERALGGCAAAKTRCLLAARGDAAAIASIALARERIVKLLLPEIACELKCNFSIRVWEAIEL